MKSDAVLYHPGSGTDHFRAKMRSMDSIGKRNIFTSKKDREDTSLLLTMLQSDSDVTVARSGAQDNFVSNSSLPLST